jgi:hypothetical protein
MPHCLVQADSVAPSADQLKRAFKSLKALTDADAVKLANDACGILVKNLSLDDAGLLQRALNSEGVTAEIVEANRLPKLPDAKFVRRLEFQPESLMIYDPLGRAVPVPWQQLSLVSAGSVRHFDMTATRTEKTVTTFDPIRGMRTRVVTDVRHKVEDDSALLLDLFLAGGAMRFQIEAGSFQFKYCFDRPELNLAQKAGLLVQMLAHSAPHAVLNRGAAALREGAAESAVYASKAALFDESTWFLWRMAHRT